MIDPETGGKIALVVGGILIGASTTYFITKKVLTEKFDTLLNDEVADLKEYYNSKVADLETEKIVLKKEVEEAPNKIYKNLIEAGGYSGVASDAEADRELEDWNSPKMREETSKELAEEQDHVPFATWKDKVDQANITFNTPHSASEPTNVVLVTDRGDEPPTNNPGQPQIVSYEEWFDDHKDYGDVSVTYFEADQVLIDDRDQIIVDVDGTLGLEFKSYFGWGGGDKDTVYICNHEHKTQYEVAREEQSYQHYILGEQFSDEHDEPTRKMRFDD